MSSSGGKGSVMGLILIITGIFLAPVGIGILLILIGIGMCKSGNYK